MKRKKSIITRQILLIVVGIIMIYPILWLFFSSFKANDEILSSAKLLPQVWKFDNYINGWTAITGLNFGKFFFNSMGLTIQIVVGTLISCTLAAYAFARLKFPFKKVLFILLMGTLMLPNQVLLIPRYIIFARLGWTDSLKPLIVPAFGGQVSGGFFIYLIIQFIRGIPNSIDEAAKIDGCNHFQTFFNIILPNIKPALFSVGIFSFIWSWNDFLQQFLYINTVENYTVSLALRLFLDNVAMVNWGEMFAMAILSIIPLVIIFFFSQKYFVEGISSSGLKG